MKSLFINLYVLAFLFINFQAFSQNQGEISIQTDVKAKLTLDGKEITILEPNKTFKSKVESGQKFMRIINLENESKVYETLINIKTNETFKKTVNFNAQISKSRVPSEDTRKNEDIIKTYLDGYTSVDNYDNNGYTALHRAVKANDLKGIEVLIGIGAKLTTRTKTQYNPVNDLTEGGATPLHLAASLGYMNVVKKLIESGADINASDAINMTPLHKAVESNQAGIVKFLLDAGASNDIKTKYYLDTPEKLAKKLKLREVLKIFKQFEKEQK